MIWISLNICWRPSTWDLNSSHIRPSRHDIYDESKGCWASIQSSSSKVTRRIPACYLHISSLYLPSPAWQVEIYQQGQGIAKAPFSDSPRSEASIALGVLLCLPPWSEAEIFRSPGVRLRQETLMKQTVSWKPSWNAEFLEVANLLTGGFFWLVAGEIHCPDGSGLVLLLGGPHDEFLQTRKAIVIVFSLVFLHKTSRAWLARNKAIWFSHVFTPFCKENAKCSPMLNLKYLNP